MQAVFDRKYGLYDAKADTITVFADLVAEEPRAIR